MKDFPWTYDQFQRYSVLKEFIDIFYSEKKIKVLDVGGLSPDRKGSCLWIPLKHIHSGKSIVLDITYCKENDFIQGNGTHLPFNNEEFEVSAALDVIEHIADRNREEFIKELVRVSKGSVIISVPFRGDKIEEVEKLLYEQLEKVYGVIQHQLLEHKEHGLPEIKSITQILAKHMNSGVSFSYGSLKIWLPYQTLKNCFMFKRNSAKIHDLLDKWMTALSHASEFQAPFSRHFWLYSKDIAQEKLERDIKTVKDNLRKQKIDSSFSELIQLNREIVDFFSRESVSALVVSCESSNEEFLFRALNSLLTQRVDFDLEICVWNIAGNNACEKMIKDRLPGVKYFSSEKNERTANALFKVITRLRGDYILIISEDILMPTDSVKNLYERAKSSEEFNLLAPRIIDKRNANHVWAGGKNPAKKMLAGKSLKHAGKPKGGMPEWIFSECLFFKREALFERKLNDNSLSKRNIFLWEKIKHAKQIAYIPDLEVYKKTSQIKILHCMHNYFPARGGSEWLMKNVSERLVERDYGIKVITTNAHSTEDYFLPGKGKNLMRKGQETINDVLVKRVPFSRKGAFFLNLIRAIANRMPLPFGEWLKMISWGPRSLSYYREILRCKDVDLIAACPLPNLNIWYARKASKRKRIPLIIIPCFHTEDRYTFHNRLYFKMLREADAVITLTDWEKNFLHQSAGVKIENLHSIGVGIEEDDSLTPIDIRQKYGITQNEIVLFLGQHGRHKGILDLIYAMRYVWKEKKDTGLVIAGNPTAHTKDIEESIATLKTFEKKRIYLIKGFSENEKWAILKSADIFVSVSPFESFGIVFLEAWLEKLPVIGCRRGGSSKIIEEFKDGLLVHDGNPIELAGAILELLESREIRVKMGEFGYSKVKEKYIWDKIIDKWENLYHDVIRRQRASL